MAGCNEVDETEQIDTSTGVLGPVFSDGTGVARLAQIAQRELGRAGLAHQGSMAHVRRDGGSSHASDSSCIEYAEIAGESSLSLVVGIGCDWCCSRMRLGAPLVVLGDSEDTTIRFDAI